MFAQCRLPMYVYLEGQKDAMEKILLSSNVMVFGIELNCSPSFTNDLLFVLRIEL